MNLKNLLHLVDDLFVRHYDSVVMQEVNEEESDELQDDRVDILLQVDLIPQNHLLRIEHHWIVHDVNENFYGE